MVWKCCFATWMFWWFHNQENEGFVWDKLNKMIFLIDIDMIHAFANFHQSQMANGSIFYVFLKGWSPLFLVHSCVVRFENFVMLWLGDLSF